MKREIIVIPLGPGDPDLLTRQAERILLDTSRCLILRTARHPVAAWLRDQGIPFENMDDYYDLYEDFDDMHAAMARALWERAAQSPISFAVMDPWTDGAVADLKKTVPPNADLRILPGVTPDDLLLASLPHGKQHSSKNNPPIDKDEHSRDNVHSLSLFSSKGLQRFSAMDLLSSPVNPAVPLLITELDSPILAGEVKLRLSDRYDEEMEIVFFPPSEKSSRTAVRIPLYALDAQKTYDHTAACYLPGVDYLHRSRFTFEDLADITSRLRAPDGCPWDSVQTHESLRPYMVEEAWEAVNAIEDQDMDHLADELGDVLFQVFIHSSIGESFDEFTLTDVVSGICRKMIHRHPHVFGSEKADTAQGVSDGWEALKRAETGSKTVGETLNDVSQSLPSLKYSIKMYKKLAQLPALRRSPEEIAPEIVSLASSLIENGQFSAENMAQLLMKCTELCYRSDADAEILLHRGVEKLKKKYQYAEKTMVNDEKKPENLTFQQLCVYLDAAGDAIE